MGESEPYGDGESYWDTRYLTEPKEVDWVCPYASLRNIVHDLVAGNLQARILHVGCGNSVLPEEMYDEGYRNILNTDISKIAIQQMKQRNATKRPELEWEVMDATKESSLDPGQFDLILDKALLDTLLCEADEVEAITNYFKEMHRLLADRGCLAMVSYAPPENRSWCVPTDLFSVKELEIPARDNKITGCHYAYICRKADCKCCHGGRDAGSGKADGTSQERPPPAPAAVFAGRSYRRCAVALVFNNEGQVLVGERLDKPGSWQMPQGGIDAGETTADAATRELHEEMGLQVGERGLQQVAAFEGDESSCYTVGGGWLAKAGYEGQCLSFGLFHLPVGSEDPTPLCTLSGLGGEAAEFSAVRWSSWPEVVAAVWGKKRPAYEACTEMLRRHREGAEADGRGGAEVEGLRRLLGAKL